MERVDASITKYYFHNGQRIAMRRNGVVQYLLGDHLGSTSLVLDANGDRVAESRYYPYGEMRWGWPENSTLPTDYQFTSQRNESSLGLYQMGARWYDSVLGRWISADTIVPEPGNPQDFNRYSYVHNSPLIHVDPSGHAADDGRRPGGIGVTPQVMERYHQNQRWWKQTRSLIVDFTPGVGDVKGLVEVFTGKDLGTGEELGAWRWLGLAGLSELRSLRHLKYADEVLELGVPIGKVLRNGEWIELGSWVRRNVSMPDSARAYQQYVTGAEAGFEFLRNDIHFDGIRMSDAGEAILLDAKHAEAGAGSFYSKVGTHEFARLQVLTEAQNQLKAAGGLVIEWHVSDQIAYEALNDLFAREGIAIDVIYTPWQ